jgi:hypothetical protein
MEDVKKSLSFRIDEDTWNKFKLALKAKDTTVTEWIERKVVMETIENKELIEDYLNKRKQWKKHYFNIEY